MNTVSPALQLSLEPRTELHCHTTCSDGGLSPTQLVAKAQEFGLSILAITDHDSSEGFLEAQRSAAGTELEILTGCECTCSEGGQEFHLLAYAFNPLHEGFQAYLAHTRAQRRVRCEHILQRLAELGMSLSVDDVMEFAGGQSVVRPHIASAMVKKGFAQSTQDAFDRFLANDAPAYVAIAQQLLEDAIDIIHNAGGLAVIAHPARSIQTHRIVELIQHGLDGIEVAHPSHNKSQTRYYRGLAREYKLIATGGSDFHGNRFYDETNFGRFSVGPEVIEKIKAGYQGPHD